MDERDDQLPGELSDVEERLRAHRHAPDAVKLDDLKRRAMVQASQTPHRKGNPVKSRLVTLMLVFGLALSAGTAGVIAANGGGSKGVKSAAQSEYKCNSGIGNGPEQPPTPPSPDCDPGNSPANNATNECEGPAGGEATQPPECLPTPAPKPNRPPDRGPPADRGPNR